MIRYIFISLKSRNYYQGIQNLIDVTFQSGQNVKLDTFVVVVYPNVTLQVDGKKPNKIAYYILCTVKLYNLGFYFDCKSTLTQAEYFLPALV